MKLSNNFTLEEMISSGTAKAKKIDNTPKEKYLLENAKALCENILQPLREAWGEPIIVSSGYRCEKLNKAVGGAANSDHKYFAAADIHTKSDKPSDNKRLFELAEIMVKQGKLKNVRQLIDEYSYNWLHISTNHNKNSYKNAQILHLS